MTKRYYPEKFNLVTSVDDVGAITDISRITGEDLFSYKKRVLESSQRIANSSYQGLINGINRELGLERVDLIEIDLKKMICGDLSLQGVSYSADVITDNRYFTGMINGVQTTAIGQILTVPTDTWKENELVGLCLTIGENEYKIKSNTSKQIKISGDMSNLVGQTYSVKANWITNSLIGLALKLNKRRYIITENTSNAIRLDSNVKFNDDTSYSVVANSPRIEVTSSRIFLYKDYVNEENYQLDKEIDIRKRGVQYSSVINEINTSAFFTAKSLIKDNSIFPAFTIRKQDSDVTVNEELIPGTRFFKLKNQHIKSGSAQFSESGIFFREIEDIESSPNGPYYNINYEQGIVLSKNIPSGRGTVSYRYMNIPFKLEATPAVITAFSDKDAEPYFFAQQEKTLYEDQRDRYISSQPRSNMIEYIAELLKVTDQNWGK
ncbi:MAG: hypothetical protein PHY47_00315 [Lachnospiraceae bacterium]|nr:hypothetical protein [Lachnospiraceae bacterium]